MSWRLRNSIRLRLQTVLQLWRTKVMARTYIELARIFKTISIPQLRRV